MVTGDHPITAKAIAKGKKKMNVSRSNSIHVSILGVGIITSDTGERKQIS